MTGRTKLLIALTALLTLCGTARATDTLSVKLYFRQDEARLDRDYRNNALQLDSFTDAVRGIMTDPTCRIEDIYIRSGASPEGGFQHNLSLSLNRGRELRDHLQSILLLPDDKFVIDAVGEDWQSLRTAVERGNVPDKEKILDILDRHADFVNGRPTAEDGSPKKELMGLNGGKTWNWLLKNIYPDLRSAGNSVVCRYTREANLEESAAKDTLFMREDHYHYHRDTVYMMSGTADLRTGSQDKAPRQVIDSRYDRKLVMAVRSNLILPLMNVGVEIPLGNCWSIALDHYYPWVWRNVAINKQCLELMFETAEVRYWFGDRHRPGCDNWSQRLLGHSIGLIGGVGYYDLERDWSGDQGEFWAAGLDYTLAVPLFKGRCHMEFEVGAGMLRSQMRPYQVYSEGGKLIHKSGDIRYQNWFGPLKAGVSFVWPIFGKKTAIADETGE